MTTMTLRNGVDVDRLVQTIGAIQEDENVGRFTFKARTAWKDGGTSVGRSPRSCTWGRSEPGRRVTC